MSRHKPLTDAERMIRKVRAESDADSNWPSSLAYECLRYEATLRAKDEQIAALVGAAQAVLDAHAYERDSIGCPIDPACDCNACMAMKAVIKEATHGS